MYKKLIWKNACKNIKDYGIYFLTLLIAVAVFYAFNSIEAQPAFQQSMEENTEIAQQLVPVVHMVSKMIAVLLAFLIVYANQFLLKRRKQEIGIYMILGMPAKKISALFVGETVVIGAAAMISGVAAGCLFSQGISVFALNMFHYDLSSYRFAFSVEALKQTVICFVMIFVLVAVFNVGTIVRVKLIDLLNAAVKNEQTAVKHNVLFVVMLVCAGILYAVSAFLIYKKEGFSFRSGQSVFCVIALCVATALLIYALSGLSLKLLRKKENWYFNGINAFFVHQISSKIQTNFVTMTIITLMLTGTICIVSLGMGMADTMNKMAADATPFDVQLQNDEDLNRSEEDFIRNIEKEGLPVHEALKKTAFYTLHWSEDLTLRDVIYDTSEVVSYVEEKLDNNITIMSVSDYNAVLKMIGKDTIELKKDTFRMNANFKFTNEQIQKKMNENPSYTIGGVTLRLENPEVLHNTYFLSMVGMNDMATMIVPDEVAAKLENTAMTLIGVRNPDYDYNTMLHQLQEMNTKALDYDIPALYVSADEVYEMFYGSFAMLAFICCYIGVILLIICVAILALQQLTETNDNVIRYSLLGRLGVKEKTRNYTLFRQIAVYFGVPLLIAATYAAVGIPKIIDKVRRSLGMEVGNQMVFLVGMLLVIYGSYFVITYVSCRRMVREDQKTAE